mgnify:FL=1
MDYIEQSLPSNLDAETACLGAVLLDSDCLSQIERVLKPNDFYSHFHRLVYSAFLSLQSKGSVIDSILTAEEIKREHGESVLLNHGGAVRIAKLAIGLPHFSDVSVYTSLVKELSVARTAIRMFTARTRDLLDRDLSIKSVIEKTEQQILSLNNEVNGDTTATESIGFTSMYDIVPSLYEQFERYHRGESTGVKTGMRPLDTMLDGGGLQPKATYVIGGAEKSGKTSLALEWVRSIVIEQGLCVPVITLEMSKETMAKRLYSMHTGIPFYRFRPGFYDTESDPMYTKAVDGLKDFANYPFLIADNIFTMSQIERFCFRAVEDGFKPGGVRVGAVVLDYLQLITLDTLKAGNREQEVSKISRAIKMLAANLDVPVIVLSSLNRVGLTEGQEPDTFNLRDSGSLAFDAEAVLFLHNPSYVPGKPYQPKEVTDINLIVARQRNGPSGRIPLKFIGPYMSFMTEQQYTRNSNTGAETNSSAHEQEKSLASLWEEDDSEYRDS